MVSKIFIDGEVGTTGLQIRDRLASRSDIELLTIPPESRKDIGARAELLNAADVAILCLPDSAAHESVSLITNQTTRVIDASSAHRNNPIWTYGFAEMTADQETKIANSRFVTNPGCWPQGVIAFIRPLVEAGLIPRDFALHVNGISGYSGGGRQMIEDYEAEGESRAHISPYGLKFEHKHLPEMRHYCNLDVAPTFVPAVGNYYKGMLSMIPLNLGSLNGELRADKQHSDGTISSLRLHEALSAHYAGIKNGFVRVMPLRDVNRSDALNPELLNGTNEMHLHVFGNDALGQAVLIAVYDNLGKGASGAAVQNLNLMIGADPRAGLEASLKIESGQ